jgi:hypothetical protein
MMITVRLTVAQARALISAAYEVEAGPDPHLWLPQKLKALRRGVEAISAELPARSDRDE